MNHFIVDNADGPPFARSVFDRNELKDRPCGKRHPSYLKAVGVVPQPSVAFDAGKDLHAATHRPSYGGPPQFEVRTSSQQYATLRVSDASNMEHSSHIPPYSKHHAGFDFVPFKGSVESRCRQAVDDFADERLLRAGDSRGAAMTSIQNLNLNCNPNGRDFMKVKRDLQPETHHYRHSEMVPVQKGKQIPRAVIAPMSQTEDMERPYPTDRFSSLPKMQRSTHTGQRNPQEDCFDLELSTSKSYGAMVPATDQCATGSFTNTARSSVYQQSVGSGLGASKVYSKPLFTTSEHSGMVSEYFDRLHPACCSAWSDDVEKSKTFNDADNGLSYIQPQTVESVLSYQNMARKSVGSRSQKAGVMTGKSVPVGALNDANRKLVQMEMTPNSWSSNQTVSLPFSSEMPLERKCGGDNRSASSTSTTCSSQFDSGYSSDRCHSFSLTSISQSPELSNLGFASNPFNSHPAPDISLGHNSSGDASCQAINCQSQHGSSAVNAPKPGVENTMEQMKYLDMLQKQIKLYRVKDEASRRLENTAAQGISMRNNGLLNTACIPDTRSDRNIIQSSCFNLERASQDSEFKSTVAKPCSAKTISGSTDFSKCSLNPLEMGGSVDNLISKKKAREWKRVDLGTVESNRDGQEASFIRPRSVICRNSADEHPGFNDFQRMQMNEAKTNICFGEVIAERVTNPQQLDYGTKSEADVDLTNCCRPVNSAEDIVNAWTQLKNERKLQVTKDANSFVSVTAPSIEHQNTSSAANKFQVSSVHVAPTFDDSCEGSKFGKQVKKSVSFSDNVALIASTEEVPSKAVDYVEYVTSFLRKRTNDLKSFEATDDRNSQTGSSSRGSLLSESRSNSSGSRTNSNVSVPESSGSSGDRDSDFYENDGSICSEEDSEGTTVDETGRIRCSLCHKRWIDTSETYCKDCSFYMSKFQKAA